MKKRSFLTTILLLIFGGFSYLQNGGFDLLTSGYGSISQDTLQRPSFEIIPLLDRNRFTHGLHKVESKHDNYLAYNPTTSALGRYQFVPKYFREDIQEITKAKTHQEFLETPAMQETFMDWYIDKTLVPGYEKISNSLDSTKFTDAELFALIHFLGVNGATEFITTNEMMEKQKVGNIDATRYLEIVNKAMEAYN